ncbi:hypothetical protein SAMN05216266_14712 [Amycolatopsis marina]|uniref:Uncharacterized protein n=1 Tax=Amycolatopsis marina TaxID=490629 RepID=A0A1I1CQF4_9PSEU|nr:hypothetical protein [Amycolatopsis marina]SFB64764.1 hypothetical protein SAMN05216266_14712 [Amycolatopsis marina]
MSDWFLPSEETVRFRPVPPPETSSERTVQFPAIPGESRAEQTTDLVLFSTPRPRKLHDWIAAQMPEPEPEWPTVDQDSQDYT